MKKKIIFALVCITAMFFGMYAIDMYMMKNNKKVIFSTWGYQYTTPENGNQILEIEDKSKDDNYTCDTALEKIYEDDKYEYYFNCIKSQDITVKYVNGVTENIKVALKSGRVTLKDLDVWKINYITQNKVNNTKSFIATVLEQTKTYIMVRPEACASEIKSSDKIVVTFNKENIDCLYGIGTKVKIYYDGTIMESYPARINAYDIYVVN